MSAGPASTSAAPPPRSGPGAPQPRRILGMSPMTVAIVAIGTLAAIGIIIWRRNSASSTAANTAAAASTTSTDPSAADTGTLQTEIADLQGNAAQDTSSDSSASAQQKRQIEALQDQIANLEKQDKDSDDKKKPKRHKPTPPKVGVGGRPAAQHPAHVAAHHTARRG